jgi:hypothetical protein
VSVQITKGRIQARVSNEEMAVINDMPWKQQQRRLDEVIREVERGVRDGWTPKLGRVRAGYPGPDRLPPFNPDLCAHTPKCNVAPQRGFRWPWDRS